MDDASGADLLAARLVAHGITTVFGLPGEENIDVVDAFHDAGIDLIVTRHEQHAAFMASTHGRLTGRPGVCLATLGPGAINLFTGLAQAELGGTPVVALTGQKARRDNDEGSFQVVDVPAAVRPIIRWATSIDDPRDIESSVDEAFRRSMSGRPGATLIELPEDVARETASARAPALTDESIGQVEDAAIAAAADRIDEAGRVVVLAGDGANRPGPSAALIRFAERTGIGVLATQLGKGAIPELHRNSCRSLGIHRPDYSHLAIEPADTVIAVGYQPVEHPPLAWNPDEDKTVIHLAPWSAASERGYHPARALVGDLADTLDRLADAVTPRDPDELTATQQTIERLLAEEDEGPAFPPSPLAIVRAMRRVLGPDDVVALDNGAYKIWFARHYPTERPQTLLLDNTLATMGAGLATATEAARLDPSRRVVAVCGDGGFLMNVQDLQTACELGLDLTVVIVRDDAYGFIGWHQEEAGLERRGVELTNPDYVALGAAFGATAYRVGEADDLDDVLARAIAEPGVAIVDCPMDYAINELLGTDLYGRARGEIGWS
ncbi:MAG: acetolactate synthase large subunit [Acidimicrobiales bacterium]|nr:acetolactate synthase large subunit [Acidimicrobiales bacterium]